MGAAHNSRILLSCVGGRVSIANHIYIYIYELNKSHYSEIESGPDTSAGHAMLPYTNSLYWI